MPDELLMSFLSLFWVIVEECCLLRHVGLGFDVNISFLRLHFLSGSLLIAVTRRQNSYCNERGREFYALQDEHNVVFVRL